MSNPNFRPVNPGGQVDLDQLHRLGQFVEQNAQSQIFPGGGQPFLISDSGAVIVPAAASQSSGSLVYGIDGLVDDVVLDASSGWIQQTPMPELSFGSGTYFIWGVVNGHLTASSLGSGPPTLNAWLGTVTGQALIGTSIVATAQTTAGPVYGTAPIFGFVTSPTGLFLWVSATSDGSVLSATIKGNATGTSLGTRFGWLKVA